MEKSTPIDNYTTNNETFQDRKSNKQNPYFTTIMVCIVLVLITFFIKLNFPSLFVYLSDIYKKYFLYQNLKIKYILEKIVQKLSIEISKIDFSFLDKFSKTINL